MTSYLYEVPTKKKLKQLSIKLPKNSVIIDAGAHIGDTGLTISKYLTDNNRNDIIIYEIEPNKSKIDFIKQMLYLNNIKNIKTINAGLSDKEGMSSEIKNKSTGPWVSGSWKLEDNENGEIRLITLDNEFKDKKVGLIHLDVEGHENRVINGAREIILRDKPLLMIETVHIKKVNPYIFEIGYKKIWSKERDTLYKYKP